MKVSVHRMRFFGKRKKRELDHTSPAANEMATSTSPALLHFEGSHEIHVVGEHYRPEAVRHVASLPQSQRIAFLNLEPDNPYDSNAVAVHVNSFHVGYLPRQIAAVLAPELARLSCEFGGAAVTCAADVRGTPDSAQVVIRLNPGDFGTESTALLGAPGFAATAEHLTREILGNSAANSMEWKGEDPGARTALREAEAEWTAVRDDWNRHPEAYRRTEQPFRNLVKRLEAANDPEVGRAWLGLARAMRYQPGRRDEVLSAFLRSIDYTRGSEEVWCEYLDYLCLSPTVDCLVDAYARMPGPVRVALTPTLMSVSRQSDRHGNLPEKDGPRLRQGLLEVVERDGDASSTAALTSELGNLQEKAGNIAEAVDLWRQAFAAGCTDLKIADRPLHQAVAA